MGRGAEFLLGDVLGVCVWMLGTTHCVHPVGGVLYVMNVDEYPGCLGAVIARAVLRQRRRTC